MKERGMNIWFLQAGDPEFRIHGAYWKRTGISTAVAVAVGVGKVGPSL